MSAKSQVYVAPLPSLMSAKGASSAPLTSRLAFQHRRADRGCAQPLPARFCAGMSRQTQRHNPAIASRRIHLGRDNEILRCPWHGWEFDLHSGQCLTDRRSSSASRLSSAMTRYMSKFSA